VLLEDWCECCGDGILREPLLCERCAVADHDGGDPTLEYGHAERIAKLEADNARLTRKLDELKASLESAHAAYERERQYHFHEVSKLKAELAQALEQRNDARRNQCELEAMVNEPEGFPAERRVWRERAKLRYAEASWPGSAAELWPESEKK
jgi:hypothetical protein